ncbi:hypothetical protein QR680_015011 [Steinernema hermaphroditum]|uniref:Transthyretin-like family protein n=1 Tax=Steinernema hermaphroditum TaxID=289476 RepID=A0AA39IAS9_9BILA|nr:hypothetical protein QR680_015011 [Steinernema hermaphroditum]
MKLFIVVVILFLPYSKALFNSIGTVQSTSVKGKLICEDSPAGNISVTLYNSNILKDTLMARGRTNANGEFELSGHATEISSIDPRVYIYHKCGKNDFMINPFNCNRQVKIHIPDEYTTDGKEPKRVFNLGVIQLAARFNYYRLRNASDHYSCFYS